MRLPLSWLNEFVKVDDIEPKDLAEKLTRAGLQVEAIETVGGNPLSDLIVVAEVLECEAHPNSDHLHVCKVTDGKETFQVVCGAPNMRQGIKTAFGFSVSQMTSIDGSSVRSMPSSVFIFSPARAQRTITVRSLSFVWSKACIGAPSSIKT